MEVITKSPAETRALGSRVAKCLTPPMTLLLDGDLASGKTTFTQGIGKALGINKTINSPSFVIMKAYEETSVPLYHMDLYRLNEVGADFDLMDYFNDGITVIEWPHQVPELLPKEYLLIEFSYLDDNTRKLKFIPHGKKYEEVLKCIA